MSRPTFQLYVKDFVAGTSMMSLAELGAYTRLLCLAWDQEPCATLPDDEEKIRRMAAADKDEWKDIREAVIAKFPKSDQFKGRRINKRLREQFDEVEEYADKMSKRGKKGADKRWHPTDPGVKEEDEE
jgi:uncharacterized protein YdaU (DUF1376 family)